MISVYESIVKQSQVLEEGTGKQIGAFLSGLDIVTGSGGITGGVQKRNLKIYQRLQDKLGGKEFRKSSPSMIAGYFLGIIPLVGSFMNLGNQKNIDKVRGEIKRKMDIDTVRKLDDLTNKAKKGEINNKELKDLAEIESQLYEKFDKEEIHKLKRIAKGSD